MIIRIGLIQMRCEKSAINENLTTMNHFLNEAAARQIDIIGFPEMSITGYANPNRYPDAKLRLDGPEIGRLREMSLSFPGTILAGIIEDNPDNKPFITHIAIRQGRLMTAYRKITIKDEEAEWFSAGERVSVFQHNNLTVGIAICADISNEAVFAQCHHLGAKLVFELAAPGLYGEQVTRNWRSGFEWWESECQKYLSRYASQYGLWIGVATQAGRTVDEDFPGGGYLFAPNGERVYASSDWLPGAVYLEIDLETGLAKTL